MTRDTHKLRAVFLAALMFLWLFAGTVAFVGSTAAEEELDQIDVDDVGDRDIGTFWQGQVLNLTGTAGIWDEQTEYDIREVDEDDEYEGAVTQIRPDEDDVVTVRTARLDDGVYAIETEDSTDFRRGGDVDRNQDVVFEIRIQDLDAAWDDDEVNLGDDVELELDSNRAGYNVSVQADGLDEDDLMGLFDGPFNAEVHDDDEIKLVDLSSLEEVDITFDSDYIDEGEYEFEFEVTDTEAEASASITVEEEIDAEASFDETVYSNERGDLVEISLQTEGDVDDVTIEIGDVDDVGYQANVTVEPNDDDEVVVLFNTWNAGANGTTGTQAGAPDDVIGPVFIEDEGSITAANETTSDDIPLARVLGAGDYDLEVMVDGDEEDVAMLDILERSLDEVTTHTAPHAEDIDEFDDLLDGVEDGWITDSDTAALEDDDDPDRGDWAIYQVRMSGFYGALADSDGLPEDDITDRFLTAVAAEPGMDFVLEQTNPGANQEPNELDIDSTTATVIADDVNNSLVVAVDTNEVDGTLRAVEEGHIYEASMTLDEEDFLEQYYYREDQIDDDEEVAGEIELVDREVAFDTEQVDGENVIVVEPADNQTISGQTTVAPGTEMTVRARADGVFLKTAPDTEVTEDRDFAAEFDFSDVEPDTEFEATIRGQGFEDDGETDGLVTDVEPETPTPTPEPETPTPEPEPDTPTPEPETPTPEEPDDDEDQVGFGAVIALVALLGAALLAARSRAFDS